MTQQSSDLEVVSKAVGVLDRQLGEDARTMLLSALPHAVGTSGLTVRHRFQQGFLSLVQGALEAGREGSLQAVKGVEYEKTEAEQQAVEASKALEAAKAALEAAVAGAAAAAEDSAEAAKAAKDAEMEHMEAKKTFSGVLESFQELEEERAKVGVVVDGSLRMLLDGGWDDEEGKAIAVQAVTSYMREIKASVAVTAAAPQALGLKPQDRQAFDLISVDAINKVFDGHLAALDQKLVAEAPRRQRIDAQVLGLWAVADCAQDEALEARVASLAAKRGQESAALALEQEQGEVVKQEAATVEREAKRARLETRVQELEDAVTAVARLASTTLAEGAASCAKGEAEEESVGMMDCIEQAVVAAAEDDATGAVS